VRPDLVVRPKAQGDIDDHAEYVARDSLDAAMRFLAATEQTFDLLRTMPEIGIAWESSDPRLQDVRRHSVKDFRNYLVFYRASPAGIEVLRVLHGARDIPIALAGDL
jgi:toxin ParE1/3/4